MPTVIAVVESGGFNVLHDDYRYPAGWSRPPAVLPPATQVRLPSAGSFEERIAQVRRGPLGQLRPDVLYRVADRRIVGIYTGASGVDLTANRSHATGTTSSAVGLRHGTAPSSLLVYVADTGPAGWKWLEQQEWIDVISTSYSELSVLVPELREVCASMQTIARQGRVVFSAVGNGEPAQGLPPAGVPENYQVGGVDDHGRSAKPGPESRGTTIPYETGDRFSFKAAAPDALTASSPFGGTSGATPSTAGRAASLIEHARTLLRSPGGFTDGAYAVAGRGARLPAQGPLRDGRLTRDELIDLLHRTAVPAEPAGPARYLVEGYGALSNDTLAVAKRVLEGKMQLPERPDEDRAHGAVESTRSLLFPPSRCG